VDTVYNTQVRRIELPGLSVSALSWGPVDGPLALCLHGFPDTAWTWRHLGPRLADLGWRVVAPFSRGYAPTSIPADGDYTARALMSDAVALHEALEGDESAVVIGHDWGAVTANALAGASDSPFGKVVSLAVPPIQAFRSGSPVLLARQARMSWYMAFNQIPVLSERSLDRLVPFLWRQWSPGYDASEDLEHVSAAIDSPARRRAVLRYYRANLRPGALSRRKPSTPTLYLHGVDDGCLSVGFADGVEDVLPPGSRVARVEHAGHFLQLEQPDVVGELISDFIGNPD
jgi:pimeloyl-ACP methyl ester carboxylesterase